MSDRVVSERELEDILGYEADFTGAFYKPTTTFLMARELLALRASREAVISALRNQGLLQNTATGVIWHVHDCPASFDFSECHYRCRVAREAFALAGTEPYHAGWVTATATSVPPSSRHWQRRYAGKARTRDELQNCANGVCRWACWL